MDGLILLIGLGDGLSGCAMKATRAVNRLPGVESCRILVSNGSVRSVGYFKWTVSRISSVSQLGHDPDIGKPKLLEYLLISPQDLGDSKDSEHGF